MGSYLEDLFHLFSKDICFVNPDVPPEFLGCLTPSLVSKWSASTNCSIWLMDTISFITLKAEVGNWMDLPHKTSSCLPSCSIKYTDPKLCFVGSSLGKFWGLWVDLASWDEVAMKESESWVHTEWSSPWDVLSPRVPTNVPPPAGAGPQKTFLFSLSWQLSFSLAGQISHSST